MTGEAAPRLISVFNISKPVTRDEGKRPQTIAKLWREMDPDRVNCHAHWRPPGSSHREHPLK